MLITIKPNAQKDLDYFAKHNKTKLNCIFDLLDDIARSQFDGLGKPEKLQYNLTGCWSRRIDKAHRLVYKIEKNEVVVLACRYHYKR